MFKKLLELFINISPLTKFTVQGKSMEPTFVSGDVVLVSNVPYFFYKPKRNDIIVLKLPYSAGKKYGIKRIERVSHTKYFVVGENRKESTDSRDFGWIEKKEIVGKVIIKIQNSTLRLRHV